MARRAKSSILDPAIAELEAILKSLRRGRKSMRLAEILLAKLDTPAWQRRLQAGKEAAWRLDRSRMTAAVSANGAKGKRLPPMNERQTRLYRKLRQSLTREQAIEGALADDTKAHAGNKPSRAGSGLHTGGRPTPAGNLPSPPAPHLP